MVQTRAQSLRQELLPSSARQIGLYSIYTILSALALYGIHFGPAADIVSKAFGNPYLGTSADQSTPVRQSYTFVKPIDEFLSFLVEAFIAGPANLDPGIRLQQCYFLVQFTAVLTVWAVESARSRNASNWLLKYVSIWALFYQTIGGAIVIPLYHIVFTYVSGQEGYWNDSAEVRIHRGRALIPAVLIGYIAPTLFMYYASHTLDLANLQALVAYWQFAPLVPDVLAILFESLSRAVSSSSGGKRAAAKESSSVTVLKILYGISFVVTAANHLQTVAAIAMSSDSRETFSYVFIPTTSTPRSLPLALHQIFQVDFWIIFVSSMLWCLQAVGDLKRLGRTDVSTEWSALLIIAGSIILGPGAVQSATWFWRESKIDAVSTTEKKLS